MYFYYEIFHRDDLNLLGICKKRNAVRAIILQNNEIVLAYLKNNREYKFPGGGVNPEESFEDALKREVKEEIGANIKSINGIIGIVIEYDHQENDVEDLFMMKSIYYEVEIEDKYELQKLDEYEKNFGFVMRKVKLEKALKENKDTMNRKDNNATKWIKRETIVLEKLLELYYGRKYG